MWPIAFRMSLEKCMLNMDAQMCELLECSSSLGTLDWKSEDLGYDHAFAMSQFWESMGSGKNIFPLRISNVLIYVVKRLN